MDNRSDLGDRALRARTAPLRGDAVGVVNEHPYVVQIKLRGPEIVSELVTRVRAVSGMPAVTRPREQRPRKRTTTRRAAARGPDDPEPPRLTPLSVARSASCLGLSFSRA